MKKLYVVGLGPGDKIQMTQEAKNSLEEAEVICGYTVYINLIKDSFFDKEWLSTPMKKEIDRCHIALQKADEGKVVAMICSGDAGVYGMASPVLELAKDYPEVEVIIISGVTAALSGGAVLGAPLTHDFAVISLSDLLTKWETIEKRLRNSADADFVICLYNTMSRTRAGHLNTACRILLEHISGETVCGWVKNIGRDGEEKKVLTLKELQDEKLDMFTTVFIGNSTTKIINDRMVTPRGYGVTR